MPLPVLDRPQPGFRVSPRGVLGGLVGLAGLLGLVVFWPQSARPPETGVEVLRTELEVREGVLYRKGALEPFTGAMIERYPDGTLLSRSTVVAGRLHGLSEGWYPNGRLQVRESFVRGISHGVRTKWHPNGNTQSVATIVEGQLHGRFLRWHEDGSLAEELSLKHGEPDGVSRAYYPSGFLKAEARLESGRLVSRQFWEDGQQPASASRP